MPEAVFVILIALVNLGGAGNQYEIGAESGYLDASVYMTYIVKAGWLENTFRGRWVITERGKIALAIDVGRRTRARALGKRFKGMSYGKFRRKWRSVSK